MYAGDSCSWEFLVGRNSVRKHISNHSWHKIENQQKKTYLYIMSIIESNISLINDLCTKYNVSKLFVFGSVLTNTFSKKSDVDFIVSFNQVSLYDYADNYFNLKNSLEKLLQRPVDLLEDNAIKNPFLRKSIDSSKQMVYGHRD